MSPSRYLLLLPLLAACGADPVGPQDPDTGGNTDAQGECTQPPVLGESVSACVPASTDYRPRVDASRDDAWAACVSDDNVYHPINASISTVGRVAAFDQMEALLWAPGRVPSPQDFVDARVLYAQDQGLDSRVQRREDYHYPATGSDLGCRDAALVPSHPDRCVGPAKLLPVLNDAFQRGAAGERPRVQAARIEAALVWFLAISVVSEVNTCTAKPQDCDSAWAYYTGGTERGAPAGLARRVRALGPETHERAYDGALAVRCWRNLDNEAGVATDLALRDRALQQYDRALLRGVALVARQRVAELDCTAGEVREARWAFVQTLVPFLDRAARERDAASADALKALVAAPQPPDAAGAARAVQLLGALFDCP